MIFQIKIQKKKFLHKTFDRQIKKSADENFFVVMTRQKKMTFRGMIFEAMKRSQEILVLLKTLFYLQS